MQYNFVISTNERRSGCGRAFALKLSAGLPSAFTIRREIRDAYIMYRDL